MEVVIDEIKIERYPVYKESGVEWLGEIPEHWKTLSNKYIFKIKKNEVGKKASQYTLLSLTLNGIIKRDMENPQGKFPAEFNTYQEVKKDDFIFCLFDVEETPRTVGLSPYDGMITGAYTVMEVVKDLDKTFLYYFYLNLDKGKRMRPLYRGLRNTIPKESFFTFKTFIPPLNEQTAVAEFLDVKTAQIDRVIAQKEKLIEHLKVRRQLLIDKSVTQGVTLDVELKDSGVKWLSQIPKHWEVVKSKRLFFERKERCRDTDEQLTASQKHGVIYQKHYMELENRRVTQVEFNRNILKHIEPGDFVISMRSFQGGIEYCEFEGCVSSAYIVLTPTKKVVPIFFKYLLKSSPYIKALSSTSNLVRDGQALRFENFSLVDLFVIPEEEQILIATFIEQVIGKTDRAVSLQEKEIGKLKEYKATLINAAVTGKIKVTLLCHI